MPGQEVITTLKREDFWPGDNYNQNNLKKGQQLADEEMEEYPLEHTYNYTRCYLFSG